LKKEYRWLRKKSICGIALQLLRCGARVSAPHSSVFARLASGAFCEVILSPTFYEIIKYPTLRKTIPGKKHHSRIAG
jgi:hypothetical protein